MIKLLPITLTFRGIKYSQVFANDTHYIYSRSDGYFEVFKRKVVDCFDFKTNLPTGEQTESFPKSDEAFGKWAWCCKSIESAMSYTC